MQNKKREQSRSEQMPKIPMEKKMKLAQYIRAENMDNRMKVRQREKILYGTESALPLWDKGDGYKREDALWMETPSDNPNPDAVSTFRLRMAAAILLFIGFLLCDAGQYQLFGYSMNDIHGIISEDFFELYEKNADGETLELSGLLNLDFGK